MIEHVFSDELLPPQVDPSTGSDIIRANESQRCDGAILQWSTAHAFCRALTIYCAVNRQRATYRKVDDVLASALKKAIADVTITDVIKHRVAWDDTSNAGEDKITSPKQLLMHYTVAVTAHPWQRNLIAAIDSHARAPLEEVKHAGNLLKTYATSCGLVSERYYVGQYADKPIPYFEPAKKHGTSPWSGSIAEAFFVSPIGDKISADSAIGAASLGLFLAYKDSSMWTTHLGVDCPEDHPLLRAVPDTDKRTAIGQRARERAQIASVTAMALLYRMQAWRWSWRYIEPWVEEQKNSDSEMDKHLLNTRMSRIADAMRIVPLHPLLASLVPSSAEVTMVDGAGPGLIVPVDPTTMMKSAPRAGEVTGKQRYVIGPIYRALVDASAIADEYRDDARSATAVIEEMDEFATQLLALHAAVPDLISYVANLCGLNRAVGITQPKVTCHLDRLSFGWSAEDGISTDAATVLGGTIPLVPIASEHARPLVHADRQDSLPTVSIARIDQKAEASFDMSKLVPPVASAEPWEAPRIRGDWNLLSTHARVSFNSLVDALSRATLASKDASKLKIIEHLAPRGTGADNVLKVPPAAPGHNYWRVRDGATKPTTFRAYVTSDTGEWYTLSDYALAKAVADTTATLVPDEAKLQPIVEGSEARFIVGGYDFPRLTFTLALMPDPFVRSTVVATSGARIYGTRAAVGVYRRATRARPATTFDPNALGSAVAGLGEGVNDL